MTVSIDSSHRLMRPHYVTQYYIFFIFETLHLIIYYINNVKQHLKNDNNIVKIVVQHGSAIFIFLLFIIKLLCYILYIKILVGNISLMHVNASFVPVINKCKEEVKEKGELDQLAVKNNVNKVGLQML